MPFAEVELYLAGGVAHIHKNSFAHAAYGNDAAGKADFRFLALFEKGDRLFGGMAAVITLRVGV